jgi:hypothetical protein
MSSLLGQTMRKKRAPWTTADSQSGAMLYRESWEEEQQQQQQQPADDDVLLAAALNHGNGPNYRKHPIHG